MDLDYQGFVERIESTKNDINYIPRIRWNSINENDSNKPMDIVPGFPMNQKIKYNRELMIKAIQNGMEILILFRGSTGKSKSNWRGGQERTIQPLALGKNKNTGNELLRGFHLEGYSVSQKSEQKKVWRLFKTSGIKSMMFTGRFFRLSPHGYKMNDRVLTEVTYCKADFTQIRRNQESLIKAGKIEQEQDVKMVQKEKEFVTVQIQIKDTGTKLDLKNPWINDTIKGFKKYPKDVRLSVMKSVFKNEYIMILGATSEKGKTVKIFDDKKKLLGSYKTVDSFTGDILKTKKMIDNISEFPLYVFVKKL